MIRHPPRSPLFPSPPLSRPREPRCARPPPPAVAARRDPRPVSAPQQKREPPPPVEPRAVSAAPPPRRRFHPVVPLARKPLREQHATAEGEGRKAQRLLVPGAIDGDRCAPAGAVVLHERDVQDPAASEASQPHTHLV